MRSSMLLAVGCLSLGGCVTMPAPVIQSNLEIQAYQTREFEVSKRMAFDATMSVLQDAGFIIESADFDTGFITGKGTTTTHTDLILGVQNETTKMTAVVQQRTEQLASIRINLVQAERRKSFWDEGQEVINEVGVRDPGHYQQLFEQIDRTIFVRQNIQ